MDLDNNLINGYDLIIYTIIIIANILYYIKFRNIEVSKSIGFVFHFTLFFLFAFVLPIITIGFEISIETSKYKIIDNFNLLYTYFRFPIYWFIGFIQFVIYKISQW